MDLAEISKSTLKRYPVYLKALRKLSEDGVKRIMSSELSEYVDIKSTTIRRDFSLIGQLGKQGYGYDVDELIKIFSRELGEEYD
ncbi:MAG: redox-sensing transcriptional repressor Rex, partial [Erysipelotrichaceae bacterium]|nr:redox-sensing transcriptional repressor Rex [Erysipelotrichaceae bacterium]